jgi:hypothetical protein
MNHAKMLKLPNFDSLPEINKNPLITCEELKHYYTNKFNISVQQLFAQLDYSADATFDLLYRINKYLNEIAPTTETSLTLDKQNNTVQFEVRSPIEEEVIKFPEVLMPIIKFAFSDSYLEKGLMPNYDCEEFTKKLSLHTLHDALEEKLEKNLSKKRLKI